MTYLITFLLALALGWTWGHTTARIVHIPIGAHADEDDQAFLDDERARYDQLIASLDDDPPDDPRSNAA